MEYLVLVPLFEGSKISRKFVVLLDNNVSKKNKKLRPLYESTTINLDCLLAARAAAEAPCGLAAATVLAEANPTSAAATGTSRLKNKYFW